MPKAKRKDPEYRPGARMDTAYRVAALMDTEVFDLPRNAEPRTRSGDPWLRWANIGSYSGWYSLGSRGPDFGKKNCTFWQAVTCMATEAGNGKMDAVHCIGPGILSMGGLGVTVSSGYAQQLYADCLEYRPLHWLAEMGPVLHSGVWLVPGKKPDEKAKFRCKDGILQDFEDLDYAIRRSCDGSDGRRWTAYRKRHAMLWVQCTSRMLSERAFDMVQVEFCRKYVPDLIRPIQTLIQWPSAGIRDGWMFTQQQQALWGVAMVAAIENEEMTREAFRACTKTSPRDAKATLRAVAAHVNHSAFSETYRKRVQNAVKRSREIFQW